MGMRLEGGRIVREKGDLTKRRVAYVVASQGEGGVPALQFITGMLLVRQTNVGAAGVPPTYEAPVLTGWSNLKHNYPVETAGLQLIGVQIAHLAGRFAGQIDWVMPTDMPKEAPKDEAQVPTPENTPDAKHS